MVVSVLRVAMKNTLLGRDTMFLGLGKGLADRVGGVHPFLLRDQQAEERGTVVRRLHPQFPPLLSKVGTPEGGYANNMKRGHMVRSSRMMIVSSGRTASEAVLLPRDRVLREGHCQLFLEQELLRSR